MIKDLEIDFTEKYNSELWQRLLPCIEKSENDFEDFELNGFEFCHYKEVIHQLQENVQVCITLEGDESFELELMYENGINAGTVLQEYSLSGSTEYACGVNEVSILIDVELDFEMVKIFFPNASRKKAEIVFNNNKERVLKLIRNQNYDNYVTNGGTHITDNYYRAEKNKLNSIGVYWKGVYETEYVQRDFV